MKIGLMELVVVFLVALFVIGPDKLPGYAKKLGEGLRAFRKASADMTEELRENVIEPLEEAQQPLREAVEPLETLDQELRDELKGVQKDLGSLGKTKKPKPAPEKPEAVTAAEPTAQKEQESEEEPS